MDEKEEASDSLQLLRSLYADDNDMADGDEVQNSGADPNPKRARTSRWDQRPNAGNDTKMSESDDADEDDINDELQKAILLSVQSSNSDQNCSENGGAGDGFVDLKQKGICRSSDLQPLPPDRFNSDDEYLGEASSSACVICADEQPTGKLTWLSKCSHFFCHGCAADYLGKSIDENIHELRCPGEKCKALLRPRRCLRYIPPLVRQRWSDAIDEAEALAETEAIICPFDYCSNMFLDDKKGYLMTVCPECSSVFCVNCRVEWHMGLTCEEYQASVRPSSTKRKRSRKSRN